MKSAKQWHNGCVWLRDTGDNCRGISVQMIEAIQTDAREGMVPAAELQAVEAEREEIRALLKLGHTLLDECKAERDRLAKYEKQWNDMNFTICKLEQDLHAKEDLLERYQRVVKQAGEHWLEWLTLLTQPPPMPDPSNLVGHAIEAMREVRRLCEELK